LLPFKLAGLWLIGGGHVHRRGPMVYSSSPEPVGLAVTAFLFESRPVPELIQLGWFVRLYTT